MAITGKISGTDIQYVKDANGKVTSVKIDGKEYKGNEMAEALAGEGVSLNDAGDGFKKTTQNKKITGKNGNYCIEKKDATGNVTREYFDKDGNKITEQAFLDAENYEIDSNGKIKAKAAKKGNGIFSFLYKKDSEGSIIKSIGKGLARSVTNMFCDDKGNFSIKQAAKTAVACVGIAVAGAAIVGAGIVSAPVLATGAALAFGVPAAFKAIKGGIDTANAYEKYKQGDATWEEVDDAATRVGEGTGEVAMAAFMRKGMKASWTRAQVAGNNARFTHYANNSKATFGEHAVASAKGAWAGVRSLLPSFRSKKAEATEMTKEAKAEAKALEKASKETDLTKLDNNKVVEKAGQDARAAREAEIAQKATEVKQRVADGAEAKLKEGGKAPTAEEINAARAQAEARVDARVKQILDKAETNARTEAKAEFIKKSNNKAQLEQIKNDPNAPKALKDAAEARLEQIKTNKKAEVDIKDLNKKSSAQEFLDVLKDCSDEATLLKLFRTARKSNLKGAEMIQVRRSIIQKLGEVAPEKGYPKILDSHMPKEGATTTEALKDAKEKAEIKEKEITDKEAEIKAKEKALEEAEGKLTAEEKAVTKEKIAEQKTKTEALEAEKAALEAQKNKIEEFKDFDQVFKKNQEAINAKKQELARETDPAKQAEIKAEIDALKKDKYFYGRSKNAWERLDNRAKLDVLEAKKASGKKLTAEETAEYTRLMDRKSKGMVAKEGTNTTEAMAKLKENTNELGTNKRINEKIRQKETEITKAKEELGKMEEAIKKQDKIAKQKEEIAKDKEAIAKEKEALKGEKERIAKEEEALGKEKTEFNKVQAGTKLPPRGLVFPIPMTPEETEDEAVEDPAIDENEESEDLVSEDDTEPPAPPVPPGGGGGGGTPPVPPGGGGGGGTPPVPPTPPTPPAPPTQPVHDHEYHDAAYERMRLYEHLSEGAWHGETKQDIKDNYKELKEDLKDQGKGYFSKDRRYLRGVRNAAIKEAKADAKLDSLQDQYAQAVAEGDMKRANKLAKKINKQKEKVAKAEERSARKQERYESTQGYKEDKHVTLHHEGSAEKDTNYEIDVIDRDGDGVNDDIHLRSPKEQAKAQAQAQAQAQSQAQPHQAEPPQAKQYPEAVMEYAKATGLTPEQAAKELGVTGSFEG